MSIENIRSVAIIGAGTMGQGIAQVCLLAGLEVSLHDVNTDALTQAIDTIKQNINLASQKNKITQQQKDFANKHLNPIGDLKQLQADLIIEAIAENLEVKQNLFIELEKINSEECIFVTNTSSISITQIASKLKHPNRFAGFHFFNPAHAMKLIEIIEGAETGNLTISVLKVLATRLNKTSVVVKDSPGFIANRVARHFYVEALKLAEEGVANIETIDSLLKSSGFKMGPFELMDLIGIDINLAVTKSLYNSFNQEVKFKPSLLQQQKVDAKHLGKKSGRGFYTYSKSA